MTQQERILQEQSPIRLKPIVSYPREAKVGERYLFTIDVQLAEDSPWPYQNEEFEISFILETAPFFTHEPVGEHEPGIVLHRYGGTYGAAEYLLTASKKPVAPGKIKVTLLNGWGLPVAQLELECEVKEDAQAEIRWAKRKVKTEEKQSSFFIPGLLLYKYVSHKDKVYTVAWSPDGTRIASGGLDGTVQIWKASDGHCLATYQGHSQSVYVVCWSPDGSRIASAGNTSTVQIWDSIDGRLIGLFNHSKLSSSIHHLAWSPDGHSLASRDDSLCIWDLSNGNLMHVIDLALALPKSSSGGDVSWSPDNQLIAVSLRNKVRIYHATTGKPILIYEGHNGQITRVVWSPDGRYIASIDNQEVRIWDPFNSITISTYSGHTKPIRDIAWSPNGLFIASASDDKLVHIWKVITEKLLFIYSGHTDHVTSISWSPDSTHIASASDDRTVHVWLTPLETQEKQGSTSSLSRPELATLMAGIRNPLSKDVGLSGLSLSRPELATLMAGIRNLLSKGVGLSNNRDRLPQLTWLLLLKHLDDFELAQEKLIGDDYIPIIASGYRWRDWVVAENPAQRRKGEALLKFVNDDLIPYLGRLSSENARDIRSIVSVIFRGTYNRIRSGYILREVVDKLNSINFNSSNDTRMIALYYETMLKEMSDSAGNSGEFYTPRPVVRFIIDHLKPQLGESLLDPACGTAGFLVETYGRLVGQVRTTEQQRQLQDDLTGIEKKPMAYLLAAMNMLLHGIEVPNIIQSNALVTNIQQLQDEDYVDIIATNPPFGGEEELSIINNFPNDMRTTETTLLFVQYIMQTLKRPGGRCGIVLPDSFLFGNGVASRIKQQLLINFNLHTIIRLPAGVFAPYTSIPTNILFFEATEYLNSLGRESSTQEVWYYEIPLPEGRNNYTRGNPIQYEAFYDCTLWWDHREENEHAWKVPVEELFANGCNLDYKKPVRSSPDPEPEFELIANYYAPYASGGIVADKRMFYGRSQLIERITRSISESGSQYKSIIIYGQKRVGKSSILYHLKENLSADDGMLILDPSVATALDEHISLIHQFLWIILSSLKKSIEDEIENKKHSQLSFVLPTAREFFQEPAPLSSFVEVFRAFKRETASKPDWRNIHVILVIDEFQHIYDYIRRGKLSEDFMKNWKTLLELRFFSVVLAGQDVMTRFQQQFPNDFVTTQNEHLGYLKREDAVKLIEEPIYIGSKDGETRYREHAIAYILELTAGSAFYIQVVCHRLVEYMNRRRVNYVTEADVEQVKNELIRGANSLSPDYFDNLISSGDTSPDAISAGDVLNVVSFIASHTRENISCSRSLITCATQMPLDIILDDLVRREVISRVPDDSYLLRVGLFKEWLIANQ